MQTELEKQLKSAMQKQINEKNDNHLQETLKKAEAALSSRENFKKIGFWEFLLRQIKFLFLPIWLVQGVILLVLIGSLYSAYGERVIVNGRDIAVLLSSSSILVILTAVPLINRSIQYRMNEIEAATRFSISRLLLAKLLMIGIGDSVMLLGLFLVTIFRTSIGVYSTIMYLLLPFLLMSCVVLYLLGHVRMEQFTWKCLVAGAITFILVSIIGKLCPWFYEQAFTCVGLGICLILVVVCVHQIHHIMNKTVISELQIS